MRDLNQRSVKFARKAVQAGLDSAVTIAARTPGLVTAGFDPTGAGAREVGLMVREKVAAAYEGALGAQLAWSSFLLKAAFGGVTSPHHVSHARFRQLEIIAEHLEIPKSDGIISN